MDVVAAHLRCEWEQLAAIGEHGQLAALCKMFFELCHEGSGMPKLDRPAWGPLESRVHSAIAMQTNLRPLFVHGYWYRNRQQAGGD